MTSGARPHGCANLFPQPWPTDIRESSSPPNGTAGNREKTGFYPRNQKPQ